MVSTEEMSLNTIYKLSICLGIGMSFAIIEHAMLSKLENNVWLTFLFGFKLLVYTIHQIHSGKNTVLGAK